MSEVLFRYHENCQDPEVLKRAKGIKAHLTNGELINLDGIGPFKCSTKAFELLIKAYPDAFIKAGIPPDSKPKGARKKKKKSK